MPDGTQTTSSDSMIRSFHYLEAVVGVLFTFVVGIAFFGFTAGGFFWVGEKYGFAGEIAAGTLGALVMVCEGLLLLKLKEELEFPQVEFSVKFVDGFEKWPSWTRPLMTLWWAAHWVLAILLAAMLEKLIFERTTDWEQRATQCVLFAGLNFTAAYATNLFGLLAVASSGAGKDRLQRLWRWRYIADLLIAAAASVVPFLWK
ncbi:MAG TPA: hypothetical protein VFE47_26730 [Tepidisphaeraceae bacterium]|jgi:hypothetical protein|nr:hypothetical protein [Tepidisphaeraceae bacterium]